MAIETNLGQSKPEQAPQRTPATAANPMLEGLEAHGIDGYVAPRTRQAPDQLQTGTRRLSADADPTNAKKDDDGGFETPYRLRKQVVEPVFGQIKQERGASPVLLRGVEKCVRVGDDLGTAHNSSGMLFHPRKRCLSRLTCNQCPSQHLSGRL